MAIMARTIAIDTQRPLAPVTRLRRCTYRKITTTTRPRSLPVYEAACTFPGRTEPASLGDLEEARTLCEACTYIGIFRPDSD